MESLAVIEKILHPQNLTRVLCKEQESSGKSKRSPLKEKKNSEGPERTMDLNEQNIYDWRRQPNCDIPLKCGEKGGGGRGEGD